MSRTVDPDSELGRDASWAIDTVVRLTGHPTRWDGTIVPLGGWVHGSDATSDSRPLYVGNDADFLVRLHGWRGPVGHLPTAARTKAAYRDLLHRATHLAAAPAAATVSPAARAFSEGVVTLFTARHLNCLLRELDVPARVPDVLGVDDHQRRSPATEATDVLLTAIAAEPSSAGWDAAAARILCADPSDGVRVAAELLHRTPEGLAEVYERIDPFQTSPAWAATLMTRAIDAADTRAPKVTTAAPRTPTTGVRPLPRPRHARLVPNRLVGLHDVSR